MLVSSTNHTDLKRAISGFKITLFYSSDLCEIPFLQRSLTLWNFYVLFNCKRPDAT